MSRGGAVLIFLGLLLSGCSKLGDDFPSQAANKCRACHEAPPADRVHAAHVGRLDYGCDMCHPGTLSKGLDVPRVSPDFHANGAIDVAIAAPFNNKGAARYSASGKTCSAVWCHGGFAGGTRATMAVTDSISGRHCASCHDLQGMVENGHLPHMPYMNIIGYEDKIRTCNRCHTGYSTADSTVNSATHVNGVTDPVDDAKCAACHGSVSGHAPAQTQCTLCHAGSSYR